MNTYAVMSGNIVSNSIISNNKEESEDSLGVTLIEYTSENPAGIGWEWNGVSFIQPTSVALPPEPTDWIWNGITFVPPN